MGCRGGVIGYGRRTDKDPAVNLMRKFSNEILKAFLGSPSVRRVGPSGTIGCTSYRGNISKGEVYLSHSPEKRLDAMFIDAKIKLRKKERKQESRERRFLCSAGRNTPVAWCSYVYNDDRYLLFCTR